MSSAPKFRTASGQTGKYAYRYELAQIRNLHRELKQRLADLTSAIAAELPQDAVSSRPLRSKTSSHDARKTIDAETMRRMLPMFGLDSASMDDLSDMIAHLEMRSPERVERDLDLLRRVRAALRDAPGTTVSSLQVDEYGKTCVRVRCGSESTLSWVLNALNGRSDLNDHPTRPRTLQVFGFSGCPNGHNDPIYINSRTAECAVCGVRHSA